MKTRIKTLLKKWWSRWIHEDKKEKKRVGNKRYWKDYTLSPAREEQRKKNLGEIVVMVREFIRLSNTPPYVNLVKFKDYYKRETGKTLSTWMYSVIIRSQVFEKVPGDRRTWKVMKTSEMITYKDFKEEYYRQLDKKREQLREWRHRS